MKLRYALLLFIGIIIGMATVLAVLFGSMILEKGGIEIDSLTEDEATKPALSEDAKRYYYLKNLSCDTLSGDFLIVTHDFSAASIKGLIESNPSEAEMAASIADGYSSNQTTKTYVRGEQLKRVIITGASETTTIWKEGRVYNCTPKCTMRLMSENESSKYYDDVYKIRNNCLFLGKTPLPGFVDLNLLLDIEYAGESAMGDYECDNFFITANSSYAENLMLSNQTAEEEKAFLWGLAHLKGPLNECLDESTGIIVYRNMTIDLTDYYLLDYRPGGYMEVNQQTRLTYFTEDVPESFLALPD